MPPAERTSAVFTSFIVPVIRVAAEQARGRGGRGGDPGSRRLTTTRHNKLIVVQPNKLICTRPNRLIIVRRKKLKLEDSHGCTTRKTGTVVGSSAEAADFRRRSRYPRKRLVAHAPRAPAGQRLSARGRQGLVYPEPPGRGESREHGLVCVVLALLRSLS